MVEPMIEQASEIQFNKPIARDTFFMGLLCPGMASAAQPGQFLMLHVGSGSDPLLRRPFSFCGTRPEGLVLILYRIVGRGTSLMSNLKEGDRISLLGPLGKGFERPGGQGSPLLVSGGMGLAPLAFLAQDLGHRRATLLAGFASAPEVVPLDPLGLAGVPASIATDDGTRGHGGPVTDLLEDALDRSGHGISTVFTCGPMAMMKRVAALCLERGIPCQASMETPMACGVGACRGCAVKADSRENRPYFHACQDGPVFWIDSLDWGQL